MTLHRSTRVARPSPYLSAAETSALLGTSRVTANAWINKGRCIGLTQTKRGFKVPRWQFEPVIWDHLPGIGQALGLHEGWALLNFFETPHGGLEGLTPQSRSMLWVQLTESVTLLDLRPHTPTWPVLTSLRFACTQELASDAERHGFAGLVYRSAQQHDHDCYTLFGPSISLLRRVESTPLVDRATGGLHRLLRDVARGAQMEFVP